MQKSPFAAFLSFLNKKKRSIPRIKSISLYFWALIFLEQENNKTGGEGVRREEVI
jgi:hypothetical protein